MPESRAKRPPKPKPVTHTTSSDPDVEQRPYELLGRHSASGRSTLSIRCPFCTAAVTAYQWSIAGSGKRCGCGALLGSTGTAYRRTGTPMPPVTATGTADKFFDALANLRAARATAQQELPTNETGTA